MQKNTIPILCFIVFLEYTSIYTSENNLDKALSIVTTNQPQRNEQPITINQELKQPLPFFNFTFKNYSNNYYLPKDINLKNGYKGIWHTKPEYLFLNTPFYEDIPKSIDTYNLHDLGIGGDGTSVFNKGSIYSVPFEPKETLAFYKTSTSLANQKINLFVGLVKTTRNIYLILPTIFFNNTSTTQEDKYFFSPLYYENKPSSTLGYEKLRDQGNLLNPYKGSLYIPTFKETSDFCAYAFLYINAKNSNQSTSQTLVMSHYQVNTDFHSIAYFNNAFVEMKLKEFCSNNNPTDENSATKIFLKDIFYRLSSRKKEDNEPSLGKNKIEEKNVTLDIAISDTQCVENIQSKTIAMHILVKIYLLALIPQLSKEPLKLDPINAVFTTHLPFYSPDWKALTWDTHFFHAGCNQDIDFYFAPNAKVMPHNSVCSLLPYNENDDSFATEAGPKPFYIKNITEHGIKDIEYESKQLPILSYNNQTDNDQKRIVESSTPENVKFYPTPLLYQMLDSIRNPQCFVEPEQKQGDSYRNPIDKLFLFSKALITQIEMLQNDVTRLREEVSDLSKGHNSLFALKNTLDKQEKNMQGLIIQMRQAKAELEVQQKECVQKTTQDLENQFKLKLEEIETNIKNFFKTCSEGLNREIANQTETNNKTLETLKCNLIETNNLSLQNQNQQIAQDIKSITTEKENLEKMIIDVKTLLTANKDLLEKLQTIDKTIETLNQQAKNTKDQLTQLATSLQNTNSATTKDIRDNKIAAERQITELNKCLFYLTTGLGVMAVGMIGFSLFLWWYVQKTNAQLQFLLHNR